MTPERIKHLRQLALADQMEAGFKRWECYLCGVPLTKKGTCPCCTHNEDRDEFTNPKGEEP